MIDSLRFNIDNQLELWQDFLKSVDFSGFPIKTELSLVKWADQVVLSVWSDIPLKKVAGLRGQSDRGLVSRMELEPFPGENAALKTVLRLIDDHFQHEIREWLFFKGELVFDPHAKDWEREFHNESRKKIDARAR